MPPLDVRSGLFTEYGPGCAVILSPSLPASEIFGACSGYRPYLSEYLIVKSDIPFFNLVKY